MKYFEKALALEYDDDDLKKLIRKNLEYAKWSLEKHWGLATGATLKWGAILGVLTIIGFSTGSAPAILIFLAIDALWVFFNFKAGYKINKDSFQYSS